MRRATVNQYVATYNADLAGYRQTVLTAFQQVEDNLAALRILTEQIQQQHKAVESTKRALDMETARYQTGVDPYIDVVTEQNALLSAQQTMAQIEIQRATASVQLIEALGGGWDRYNCRRFSKSPRIHRAPIQGYSIRRSELKRMRCGQVRSLFSASKSPMLADFLFLAR